MSNNSPLPAPSIASDQPVNISALHNQHSMALADAVPQIVWTANANGELDYYNQHWIDYTGMSIAETLGWGWAPVLHPDDLPRCIDVWTKSCTTGEPYQIEYRFKRASDGSYRWHLGRALPVRDLDGKIIKWFGTCTDIDEQKQAFADVENKVRERTAELASANESLLAEIAQRRLLAEKQQRDSVRLNEIIAAQCQLTEAKLDLEAFFQLVVNRIDMLTGATGSVIELVEGDDMVYRAGSGLARTHVGLRLKRASSISGLCVRTQEVLYCADSEEDERVDRAACLRIGVRAMVVAPLFHEGKVIGVLKAMSSHPHVFGEADMQSLQLMAGLIGSAIAHQTAFSEKEKLLGDLNAAVSEMKANERRTRTVIESAHDAFVAVSEDGRITDWNRQAEVTFGWTRQEALGQKLDLLIIPLRYREAHVYGMDQLRLGGDGQHSNKRIELIGLRKNGVEFPVELTINVVKNAIGVEFCAFLHDITDRKHAEESLRHMAQMDQLTGLPNRRLLNDRLATAMARVRRSKKLMALMYLDIDHFKSINDTLGHGVGDALLTEFAARLTSSVRVIDTVARLGGDEFVMLLEQLQEPADSQAITDKILNNVRREVTIDGHVLHITTSLGGAFYSGEDMSPDDLIAVADEALYKAKQAGRNQSYWAQKPSYKR
jgi:diguanylate cyclase (GGDEF)-like protein/PAS domain S-box-containing protein